MTPWACLLSRSVVSNSAAPWSPLGSSIRGISQAGILGWVVLTFSRGDAPDLGIKPAFLQTPSLALEFFTTALPKAQK